MIKLFNDYLLNSKSVKKLSTYNYEYSLFLRLEKVFKVLKITKVRHLKMRINDIADYLKSVSKVGISNESINKYLKFIRQVFKYHNISIDIKLLKTVKRHYGVFSEQELKLILNYVYRLSDNVNSIVYRLMVFLLLDTGCRINELLNIEKKNIDLNTRSIYITQTKNGEPRYVFYTHLSSDILNEVMKLKGAYLFYNQLKNRQMVYNDVKYILRKISKDAGVKKIHSHMFRHTMATLLYSNGASLVSIQQLLGHKSLQMTQIYIHMSIKKTKDDYDKYMVY